MVSLDREARPPRIPWPQRSSRPPDRAERRSQGAPRPCCSRTDRCGRRRRYAARGRSSSPRMPSSPGGCACTCACVSSLGPPRCLSRWRARFSGHLRHRTAGSYPVPSGPRRCRHRHAARQPTPLGRRRAPTWRRGDPSRWWAAARRCPRAKPFGRRPPGRLCAREATARACPGATGRPRSPRRGWAPCRAAAASPPPKPPRTPWSCFRGGGRPRRTGGRRPWTESPPTAGAARPQSSMPPRAPPSAAGTCSGRRGPGRCSWCSGPAARSAPWTQPANSAPWTRAAGWAAAGSPGAGRATAEPSATAISATPPEPQGGCAHPPPRAPAELF
mmetsp:Transcript_68117/g.197439  ORF Transcript_68117/g.197439 Transcript_68117/m.197439 type:complete len:331 (-) Transcript_68117:138-1130(-)